MAITWDVKITPIDVPNRIVKIVATRTDDAGTDPVYTVGMGIADISTAAKKLEAMDIIWEKYQRKLAYYNTVETLIGILEATAKTNLEGRES